MTFVRKIFAYAGIDIVAALIMLTTSPIITRLLTQEQYGVIPFFIAAWGTVTAFRLAGLDSTYIFYKSDKSIKQAELISTSTYIAVGSTLATVAIFSIFVWNIPWIKNYGNISSTELITFLIMLVFITIVDWFLLILRFDHQAWAYSKIAVIQKIFGSLIALPAIYYSAPEDRLLSYLVSLLIASTIAFIYAIFILKKLHFSPFKYSNVSIPLGKKAILFGIPFIPGALLYSLITVSDRVLIGFFSGAEEVALLALAISIATIVTMMKRWLTMTINPYLSDWISSDPPELYLPKLSKICFLLTILFSPVIIFITIWIDTIIAVIYPESFYGVNKLIPLLSLGGLYGAQSAIAITTILISRKNKQVLLVNAIALAVNLVFCLTLIPTYGALGGVMGTVNSELCILLSWIYIGKKVESNLHLEWSKTFLVTLFTTVFCYSWSPLSSNIIKVLITIVILLIFLLLIYSQKKSIVRMFA